MVSQGYMSWSIIGASVSEPHTSVTALRIYIMVHYIITMSSITCCIVFPRFMATIYIHNASTFTIKTHKYVFYCRKGVCVGFKEPVFHSYVSGLEAAWAPSDRVCPFCTGDFFLDRIMYLHFVGFNCRRCSSDQPFIILMSDCTVRKSSGCDIGR